MNEDSVATGSAVYDALQRHALMLLGGALQRAWLEGWIRFDTEDGLQQWPEELARLFARHSLQMVSAHRLEPHDNPPSLSVSLCWERLSESLDAAANDGDEAAQIWQTLSRGALGLSSVEVQLLAVLVICHLDQDLVRAYRFGWANRNADWMTWGYATKLLSRGGQLQAVSTALDPERAPLFGAGLARLSQTTVRPLSEQPLAVDTDLARLLVGWPLNTTEYQHFSAAPDVPQRLSKTLRTTLRRMLTAPGPRRAAVFGPLGTGRLAVVAQWGLGAGASGGLWLVDLAREVTHGRLEQALQRAHALSAALNLTVVVRDTERLDAGVRRKWCERLEEVFVRSAQPLAWVFDTEPPEYVAVPPAAVFGLGYPSRLEREVVWTAAFAGELDPAMLFRLAGQYLLGEGQIARLAKAAKAAHPNLRGEALLDVLEDAARQAAQVGLGQLATPESGRVSLDQVILSSESRLAIEELIGYSRNRHRLAHEWGFSRGMPYGLGVTALFTGPPGTGKTYSARAVATALGLELYRVDLSQLVSKYIGETEKHLSQLFAAAENGEIMLLFDEADSLFSKRTSVKSSVDRYANLEVNYLLQRIEHFTGVVILTTNFEAGLDSAFARRIRFRIAFDEPEMAEREALWRVLFPPEVPVHDDVDFEQLAEVYELSGGHIKEVVLRAASLALDRPDPALRRVDQWLLIRSADFEYKKLGKMHRTALGMELSAQSEGEWHARAIDGSHHAD